MRERLESSLGCAIFFRATGFKAFNQEGCRRSLNVKSTAVKSHSVFGIVTAMEQFRNYRLWQCFINWSMIALQILVMVVNILRNQECGV